MRCSAPVRHPINFRRCFATFVACVFGVSPIRSFSAFGLKDSLFFRFFMHVAIPRYGGNGSDIFISARRLPNEFFWRVHQLETVPPYNSLSELPNKR